MREALDRCLRRMREGETLAACLADHPEHAPALEPLLRVAAALADDAERIVAPRPDLSAGRGRMLAAASALREAHGLEATAVHTNGQSADPDADEALDRAIARRLGLAGAESKDGSGNGKPSEAMLRLAERLRDERREPPPAPAGLAAGRTRLLAVASAAAGAEAEDAEVLSPAAERLDQALSQNGAARKLDLEPETLGLVTMAERLGRQAIIPPAPPAGLAPGRERMLQAAGRLAELRGAAATTTTSSDAQGSAWASALGSIAGFFGRGGVSRLALASMAALLLFLGASQALGTQASEALPGDPLYGIKRINESVDLLMAAFNADSVADLRAEQARLRASELEQLMALGREEEASIEGALLDFGREGSSGDEAFGSLSVRVPPRGENTDNRTYGWSDKTSFDPGAWGSMSSVPRGSRLKLRVISARSPSGHALALSVRVLDQPDQPMTATVTATLTVTPTRAVTPTATGQVTTVPVQPSATATVGSTPTSAATTTLQPTPPVTATVLASPTALPSATADPDGDPAIAPRLNRFRGLVIDKRDRVLWTIMESISEEKVDFDLSMVPAEIRESIEVGDLVSLSYRKGTTPRQVVEVEIRNADAACREGQELGTVDKLDGSQIFLTNGRVYTLPERLVDLPGLVRGAEVEITYLDCLGQRELIDLKLLTPPADEVTREGLVENLEALGQGRQRFRLDTGETVEVGPDTQIRGMSTRLAEGQWVEVTGRLVEDDRIEAETILIIEAAAPTQEARPTEEIEATPSSEPRPLPTESGPGAAPPPPAGR